MQSSGHTSRHPYWGAPGRCPDFPHLPAAEEWLPSLQCISFEGNKCYLIRHRCSCCSIQLGTRLLCVPPCVSALRVAPCLPREKQTSVHREVVTAASAPPWHKGRLPEETGKAGAHREFASVLQSRICSILPSAPLHLSSTSFLALQLAPLRHLSFLSILHISLSILHLPRKSHGNNVAFAAIPWSTSLGCASPPLRMACYCKGYRTGTVCCTLLLQLGACPAAPIVVHRIGFLPVLGLD